MAPFWRQIALILVVLSLFYAGFSLLEQAAIIYMDYWVPLTSMEQAEWLAIAFSQTAEFIRTVLVGIAVYLIARVAAAPTSNLSATRFLGFWTLVSLCFALAILGLDSIGYTLQFGAAPMGGETFRTYFLLLLYGKVVVSYVSLRLLFGAGQYGSDRGAGLRSAWAATSTMESLLLFVIFFAIKLSIEGVVIPILSYLPFVAPFWFVPDETAPHRYLVGQGTRVVAETLALSLYALAWLIGVGRTAIGRSTANASS